MVQSRPSESQESLDCSLGVGESTLGMGSVAALRGAGGGRWVGMGSGLSSGAARGVTGVAWGSAGDVCWTCWEGTGVRGVGREAFGG